MKLSVETVNVLKNFSMINPSVMVEGGNEIVTMAPSKTIVAKAKTDEQFRQPFAIYELSKFLGIISMLEEPEYDWGKDSVEITAKNGNVTYAYADPSMIVAPIAKSIPMENIITTFQLEQNHITNVIKAASILQTDLVRIYCEDGNLKVGTADYKNPGAHKFDQVIKEIDNVDFSVFVKTENIVKVLPDEYTVSVDQKQIIEFRNNRNTYWIVSENKR